MDEKELFAVSIVVLVALAVALSTFDSQYLFSPESYSHALNIEKMVKGEQVSASKDLVAGASSLYYGVAAFLYSRAAAFAGGGEFNPGLLVKVLNSLSALLAAAAGVGAYYAFRGLYSREWSAFGAIMAVASIVAVSTFASGFVSPASLGIAAFFCGLALFVHAIKGKDVRFSVGAGLLFALSVAAWNYLLLTLAAVIVGVIGQAVFNEYKKEKNSGFLKNAGIAVVIGLIGVLLGGIPVLGEASFVEVNLFLLFVPFVAIAFVVVALKLIGGIKFEEFDAFVFLFGVGSIVAGLYLPHAALPGLALLVVFQLEDFMHAIKDRRLALIAASIGTAFAFFVILVGFLPAGTAALIGALLGGGAGFAAAMYKGEHLAEYTVYSLAVAIGIASVASALFVAQNQVVPVYGELEAAVNWISASTPKDSVVSVAGQADTYAFLTQRKVVSDGVAAWLLSPENYSQLSSFGANYLLLDSSLFDRLEYLKNETGKNAVRMDSFAFAGTRMDETGRTYGVFVSQTGNAAFIPFNQQNGFDPTADAMIAEASGNTRKVPFARFVLLKDEEGKIVRAIYPYDAYNVNLFNAFFGSVSGLEKAYPEGEGTARVYKVT